MNADSQTTHQRPDQWYRDALERKRKTEARLFMSAAMVKPAAFLIFLAAMAVIAWKL